MASSGLYCILALQAYVGVCFGEEVVFPQSFNGAVDGNVVFTPLSVPPPPYNEATWNYKNVTISFQLPNGQVLYDEMYKNRANFNKTSLALELQNLNMMDAGEYQLTGKKNEITFMGTTSLNVFEPVSSVTITPRETELVEFNSTVSLTCSASGSSPSFYWLNGSSELTAGGRVQLNDGNTTLIITSVIRDDIGPYRCGAFNIVSKDMSQTLTLTIYYGPDKATVAAAPVGPFYSSGCNVTLRCSAESSPGASFQWAVSGTVLGGEGPELKLSNIQTSQSGSYSCIAHNTKSLRYSTSEPITITVLETISQVTLNGSTDLLLEGSSFSNLTCEGSGTILSTKWMKDNQILSPSNNIMFSANNRSVLINPVRRSDSGEYQCTLSNPVSSDTAKYNMTVNYGPDKVVIKGPSEVVVEGEAVTLLCITDSTPAASFTWEFNGTKTEVTTESYTVDPTDFTLSGKYTCTARNHVTNLNACGTHVLVVKAKGSADHGTSLSTGAIVGIVIGVLLGVAAVAGLVAYFMIYKGRSDSCSRSRDKGNAEHELNYADIRHFQNNPTVPKTGGTNVQMQHGSLAVGTAPVTNTEVIYSEVRKK